MNENDVLMTTAEAARRAGLTPTAMRVRRLRGKGPPFVKDGTYVRYPVVDFNAWMGRRRVDPEAESRRARAKLLSEP